MFVYVLYSKINIGDEFQAAIPNCVFNFEKPSTAAPEVSPPLSHEALIWEPMSGLSQEDEDTIDGYLELACSPAVPYGGRNKELALQLLKQVNGSVKVKGRKERQKEYCFFSLYMYIFLCYELIPIKIRFLKFCQKWLAKSSPFL